MSLTALEIPENISDWPTWLERHIVTGDLRSLVMQLEVISDSPQQSNGESPVVGEDWESRLRQVLGGEHSGVLNSGLGELSVEQLKKLVQQPRLLLALQEQVFIHGGPYWQAVPRSESQLKAADAIRQQLIAKLSAESEGFSTRKPEHVVLPHGNVRLATRKFLITSLTLAACLLLVFYIFRPTEQGGRYFASAGLLTSEKQGNEYLKPIAQKIREDWQRSNDAGQFPEELRSLRDSCDELLAADLHQLAPSVAADLKARCQKWRTKFTEYLSELDSGMPVEAIKIEADQTVNKLVGALEELS